MGNETSQPSDNTPLPKQRVVKLTEEGTLEGGTAFETEAVQREAQNRAEGYRPPFVLLEQEFRKETDSDFRFVCKIGRSPNKTDRMTISDDCEATLFVLPKLSDVSSEWPILVKDGHTGYALEAIKLRPLTFNPHSRGVLGSSAASSGNKQTKNPTAGEEFMVETLEFSVNGARDYLKLHQWPANLFVPDQQKMRWPLALELRSRRRRSGSGDNSFLPGSTTSTSSSGSTLRQRGGTSSNNTAGGSSSSSSTAPLSTTAFGSSTSTWAESEAPGDKLPPEGTLMYFFGIHQRLFTPQVVEKFLVGPKQQVFHVQDLFGGDAEDKDCVICYSAPVDTFVMPCKHLCLCSDCATTLQLRMLTTQNGQTAVRCPLCRGDIANCIRLDGRPTIEQGPQEMLEPSPEVQAENKKLAEEILARPVEASESTTWMPWIGREKYADGDVAQHNPLVRRRVEQAKRAASSGNVGGAQQAGNTNNQVEMTEMGGSAVAQGNERIPTASTTAVNANPPPASPATSSAIGESMSNMADSVAQAFNLQKTSEPKPLPPRVFKRVKAEFTNLAANSDRLKTEGFEFKIGEGLSSSSSSSSTLPRPESGLLDATPHNSRFLQMHFLSEKLPDDSALGKQAKAGRIERLVFELMFSDHYPMDAPKVRLVTPTASLGSFWVQNHGALCMELLSADGWSPVISLEQLAFSIRAMMVNCGSGTLYPNTRYENRELAHEAAVNVDRAHKGTYGNMKS
ncbi:unnamed protein product [Amoebophrya sp. A120]|nr:unnamed protein product [Amoebophrya sp. A120]|eukprot:GSA120T00013084001.1